MTTAFAKPLDVTLAAQPREAGSGVGVGSLVFFILFGGIALRLMLFLSARPLWLDEAMLANNIRTRTILQLFRPLDNHQGAPVGFLILEKIFWNCLHTDWSLRLVSLVAGCATLLLIDVLAKWLLPGAGRAFTALLAATSLPLIYYSTEIKPYALDAAIALLIAVCAIRWTKQRSSQTLLRLKFVGVIAVWFSFPAIFVLAAVIGMLWIEAVRARDQRMIRRVTTLGGIWLLSFVAVYTLTMRHLSHDPNLTEYWEAGFMPYSHTAGSWILRSLTSAFRTPGGFQSTKLAAITAIAGAAWLCWNGKRGWFTLLMLIVAIPLVAGMMHQYPFEGRLILFVVPAEILLIVCGAVAFPLQRRFRAIGVIVSLLLSTFLLRQTVQDLPALFSRSRTQDRGSTNHLAELGIPPHEDMVSALNEIKAMPAADRALYVIDLARPAFEYYSATRPTSECPAQPTFFNEETDLRSVISQIAARPHATILLSHLHLDQDDSSLDRRIIHAINATQNRAREVKFSGCCLICVEPK